MKDNVAMRMCYLGAIQLLCQATRYVAGQDSELMESIERALDDANKHTGLKYAKGISGAYCVDGFEGEENAHN